jgi:hypothetical protein
MEKYQIKLEYNIGVIIYVKSILRHFEDIAKYLEDI